MSGYAAFQGAEDTGSDFGAHSFLINQIINKLATTAVVKIMAVKSVGEVAPVGFVDIQPIVNQVDREGNPTPHGVIHNVPYFRLQGGVNAVIMDPQVNDMGIAMFCSRDISRAKRQKSLSNPGSNRKYDWADALYIGGILNGTPTQYFRFSTSGIDVVSPTMVTITSPIVKINASTSINVTTPVVNGDLNTVGALTNNTKNVGSAHVHTGVLSGGSVSGPPV